MAGKKGRSGGKHGGDQGGRPSTYDRATCEAFCKAIEEGCTLRQAAVKANEKLSTLMTWVSLGRAGDDALIWFSNAYKAALDTRADILADQVLDIADDGSNDWYLKESKDDDGGWPAFDQEHFQRSKLRIETRLKLLSKTHAQKYGDKLQHTGEGGGPIQAVVNFVPHEKK